MSNTGTRGRLQHGTVYVTLVAFALTTVLVPERAAQAQEAKRTITMIDLSTETREAREVLHDVVRALRRSSDVRYRDLTETLHAGSEDLAINNVNSAKGLLESGRRYLLDKNYSDAEQDLDQAVTLFEQSFAYIEDESIIVEAMLLLGVARGMLNKASDAKQAFERATAFRPKHPQDLSEYPLKVQKLYQSTRDEYLEKPGYRLEVRTEPELSEVWVDGGYKGLGPVGVEGLRPGRHYVRVYKHGYVRQNQVVTIKREDAEVTVTLEGARRRAVYEGVLPRLLAVFSGSVNRDAIAETKAFALTDQAVLMRVTGQRETLNVELALVHLGAKQVIKRASRTLQWTKRDKKAIDDLVAEVLKAPETPVSGPGPGQQQSDPVVKKWWFWAIIGGVAAGTVLAVVLATRKGDEPLRFRSGTGAIKVQF